MKTSIVKAERLCNKFLEEAANFGIPPEIFAEYYKTITDNSKDETEDDTEDSDDDDDLDEDEDADKDEKDDPGAGQSLVDYSSSSSIVC